MLYSSIGTDSSIHLICALPHPDVESVGTSDGSSVIERYIRADKNALSRKLKSLRDHLTRRTHLNDHIKERENKSLLAEKKGISVLLVAKRKDLTRCIAAVAEELEELRSERALVVKNFAKGTEINTSAWKRL